MSLKILCQHITNVQYHRVRDTAVLFVVINLHNIHPIQNQTAVMCMCSIFMFSIQEISLSQSFKCFHQIHVHGI